MKKAMTEKNGYRATKGGQAVKLYREDVDYNNCKDEKDETVATDLITNILHFADKKGFGGAKLLERAQMHYEAETTGKEPPIGLTQDDYSDLIDALDTEITSRRDEIKSFNASGYESDAKEQQAAVDRLLILGNKLAALYKEAK